MNYKDTLLMPKTTFEMKANLQTKELSIQENWLSNKIYEETLLKNKDNKKYVFLDGPPYANGNIHIGHALNKILKDINIRFRNIQGMYAPFMLGWDTHGLPIENAIEKLGVKKNIVPREEFRNLCKEYALKQIEIQKIQFKRLGLFTDYKTQYFTLDRDYEYSQLSYFYQMLEDGLVYQNFKPIYWSWSSESALAEAEIEYLEKTSNSIYVKLDLIDINDSVLPENTQIVIWTTTPWTLPGNQAVAINKNLNYCLISDNSTNYIICKNLVDKFLEVNNLANFKIIKDLTIDEIKILKYKHPLFSNQINKVVISDHVTSEDGTGIVHIAPGHGQDDYIVGTKNNLNVFSVVNERGIIINSEEFNGLFYSKADKSIIEYLNDKKTLLSHLLIKHQYPHDWRTKKPVIFRATLQWFISVKNIKNELLNNIKKIESFPSWGKDRLHQMIDKRDDWCISRQRYWGVPIAIFFDENKNPIIKKDIFEHLLSIFKVQGSDAWYKLSNKELLPAKYINSAEKWTKELDIMDVWLDSGTSFSQLEKIFDKNQTTADLYLEGNDQFRGWFNSSLIMSTAINKTVPYNKILTHGFVLDELGHKMSKSKGNVVDPLKVIQENGADVLRLWVSSVDYLDDVRIGKNSIKQVAENYRKIRNTLRFLLGNLSDVELDKENSVELKIVDKFMLSIIEKINNDCQEAYKTFKYDKVVNLILNFCINELSGFYLDFAKDILYVDQKNSTRREQILFVIQEAIWLIIYNLAPILPHTCEEAYQSINTQNKKDSLFLTEPRSFNSFKNDLHKDYNNFWKLKNDVYKALEIARAEKIIGKSLEAKILINLKPDFKTFSDWDLRELFMVSDLEYTTKETLTDYGSAYIEICKPKEFKKCERCWRFYKKLSIKNPEICKRCELAVSDCIKNDKNN